MGVHEMDSPLCGAAVISHNEVSVSDHHRTARRRVQWSKAFIEFQGRGCNQSVQRDCCISPPPRSRYFSRALSRMCALQTHRWASDPGIHQEPRGNV